MLTLRHVLWKQADRGKRAFYLAFAACTAIDIAAPPEIVSFAGQTDIEVRTDL